MARLRDPQGGCPWDLAQNFESVVPYTIEEAYEVADVIERGALGELKGELGDLLFQVVFHARMAEEEGLFNFVDVVEAIITKMTRRHPHVFGDVVINSVAEQSEAWAQIKREEQGVEQEKGTKPGSLLDGITRNLPAMSRAEKLQRRVAHGGYDGMGAARVITRIGEGLAELEKRLEGGDGERINDERLNDELGDLLFSCTNLARLLDIDGEQALRKSSERFETRFRTMESQAHSEGGSMKEPSAIEPSGIELNELWKALKREK